MIGFRDSISPLREMMAAVVVNVTGGTVFLRKSQPLLSLSVTISATINVSFYSSLGPLLMSLGTSMRHLLLRYLDLVPRYVFIPLFFIVVMNWENA